MWEKILTEETLEKIIASAFDEDDATEDMLTMREFVEYLMANVDYKSVVILATAWGSYDENKQVYYAMNTVDERHASRFMIMMDSLSERFIEGRLK